MLIKCNVSDFIAYIVRIPLFCFRNVITLLFNTNKMELNRIRDATDCEA